MDVKCERCGTEYEFEDSRVTEDGVSVQCSSCGYLFRIRRRPVAQETKFEINTEGKNRLWMVRKSDSTILIFKELAVLQKWIAEGKIFREDEISRTGENWKCIGDIAELASFFRVIDEVQPIARQYSPSTPPPLSPSSTPPIQSQSASGATPHRENGWVSSPPAAVMSPSAPPLMPVQASGASNFATAPTTNPGVPTNHVAMVSTPPMQPAVSMQSITPLHNGYGEPDSWGDLASDAAEDDVVEKWKRRGRRKWFFIGPVLLIAIGIGVTYVLAPAEVRKIAGAAFGLSGEQNAPASSTQDTPNTDERKNAAEATVKTESAADETPRGPIKPVEPDKPVEPTTAIAPTKPIQPATPPEALKPVEPPKPVEPAKAIEPAKPTTYDGWMNQADRLQRAKRTREALAAYDAALGLKAEDVEALTGKGQCLMALRAHPAAMALFERALIINPQFGDALIGLAEANKRQGNTDEALRNYQRYLDLLPDGPDADLARENINELTETH